MLSTGFADDTLVAAELADRAHIWSSPRLHISISHHHNEDLAASGRRDAFRAEME